MWKVMNHPLANDITLEQIGEHAIEFLQLIGAPLALTEKVTQPPIYIESFKGTLPEGLIEIKAARFICDTCKGNQGRALRSSTDSFHISYEKDKNPFPVGQREYTYSVQKNRIFISEPSGFVQMVYLALDLDEDGFPLIPDNVKVLLGLEFWILYRHLMPLWMAGKIPDKVYSKIETEAEWYKSAANTSLQMPTADRMQSIVNGISRIILNSQAHDNFFRKFGEQERIKRFH